jgi:hypothetical protein
MAGKGRSVENAASETLGVGSAAVELFDRKAAKGN